MNVSWNLNWKNFWDLFSKNDDNASSLKVSAPWVNAWNVKDALIEIKNFSVANSLISYSWDYIPWTDNSSRWANHDADKNKWYVMLKPWKIVWIWIVNNPKNQAAEWTYSIVKNDWWDWFSEAKRMTSINQWATWIWDANNSAYNNNPAAWPAGLTFNAWDIIRAYHVWSDDKLSNLTLYVIYN